MSLLNTCSKIIHGLAGFISAVDGKRYFVPAIAHL